MEKDVKKIPIAVNDAVKRFVDMAAALAIKKDIKFSEAAAEYMEMLINNFTSADL